MDTSIRIKKIREYAEIPFYASPGSAGFDFVAAESTWIMPGQVSAVPTGWAFEIPEGKYIDIRPRSGRSKRFPSYIANSPGTIDSDYRGEIMILVYNPQSTVLEIPRGERIAQGILKEYWKTSFRVTQDLSETARGSNGFGSTGSRIFKGENR